MRSQIHAKGETPAVVQAEPERRSVEQFVFCVKRRGGWKEDPSSYHWIPWEIFASIARTSIWGRFSDIFQRSRVYDSLVRSVDPIVEFRR